MGGDAGCGAGCEVGGYGVGGLEAILVFWDHLGEFETVGVGRSHGDTDVAAGVPDHEGHLLGGYILSGNDQVAFVFSVCGVEDYEKFSSSESFHRLFDRIES